MVIKNGSTLSKNYFRSYLSLRMNTLDCSLEEAREQTYNEFFAANNHRFGKTTYDHFLAAVEEMRIKQ